MGSLAQDIRSARLAVERVLDEIGLEAYLYTVEPREEGWSLRVECPVEEGWQELTLPVDRNELSESLRDGHVRQRLRSRWGSHFRAGHAKMRAMDRLPVKR